MVTAEFVNPEDPYADSIRRFIGQQFPATITSDTEDTLEGVFLEVVATGRLRYGPKPYPESQVQIREVLRKWIERGLPIPFLVPWGSEKPDGSGPDIAEVMGLRMMECLNERIKRHYPVGAIFNIRIEDASAPYFFQDRFEEAWKEADAYSTTFHSLVKSVMGTETFPFRESSKVSPKEFAGYASRLTPLFRHYLLETDNRPALLQVPANAEKLDSYGSLLVNGWRGIIPQKMRGYYYGMYAKNYGAYGEAAREILSRYFASSLTRRTLGITGANSEWEGWFLQLQFHAPVPGSPVGVSGRNLYYRTLPEDVSSNHMAPWRAKGYLVMEEDGPRPRLASFREEREYNRANVLVGDRMGKVSIACDYVVEGGTEG